MNNEGVRSELCGQGRAAEVANGLKFLRGSLSSRNPATAQDQVVLVKNCSLAGCNRSLRRFQVHFGAVAGKQLNCCRRTNMGVADFYSRIERFRRVVEWNPITTFDEEGIT